MNKYALLFAGQGSQESGMGKDLAEKSNEYMNLWKKAEKISGLDLRSIYWESNDNKLMADTKNLQPAQFVTTMNYFLYANPKLPKEFAVAGHSLGEFMALSVAKTLEINEALELVCIRGKLMAESNAKGAMCAIVKVKEDELKEILAPVLNSNEYFLTIANYNCLEQFVISGDSEAITKAGELLKLAGKGRAIPLAVSAAFHTKYMQEAASEFNKALAKCNWRKPSYPIYSNVTGNIIENVAEVMSKQMVNSVLFIKLIENMYKNGYTNFIEIGPKDVLTKLVSKILVDKNINLENWNSCQKIDEGKNYAC